VPTLELAQRVRVGDRRALGQAITLAESTLSEQRLEAEALLAELLPHTGGAHRVAITGPPGAGKSTLVDALGAVELEAGRRVAVLAIDPASAVSGGSLLGDAVRMQRLSASENAFVRASSNAGRLGGIAPGTRESVLLCEAAGYQTILIETVGVGQAEQAARDLCDTLVVLTLAAAGDEIQGLKRGLLEVADAVLVNKADGQGEGPARSQASALTSALGVLRRADAPHVGCLSAATGAGVAELSAWLAERQARRRADGSLERLRTRQLGRAFDAALTFELMAHCRTSPLFAALRQRVLAGTELPTSAARALLRELLGER
jgi:LAO/AO transport system kinase